MDEVRATVVELKNVVCLFSQLSAASNLQFHGFDEKEIKSHVEYCKHLLEFAKFTVRWSSACEDQLNKQRLELLLKSLPLRKISESRGPVETSVRDKETREDELKQVIQQEEHLEIKLRSMKNFDGGTKK